MIETDVIKPLKKGIPEIYKKLLIITHTIEMLEHSDK